MEALGAKSVAELSYEFDKEHFRSGAYTVKLDAWLKETGAAIPEKDDRFDPAKKQQQIEVQKTKRLKALEANHARYFK